MSALPQASADAWRRLAQFVDARLGLDFTRTRWLDLQRGFAPAMRDLGFDDAAVCIDRLVSEPATPATLQTLASHLTIGETYFLRDPAAWQALERAVLPELIRARRAHGKYLRLWCAACCTGEEPYTLAILLHRLLADLRDWNITLIASDVNVRYLDKARIGNYLEWSFRNAPDWLKPRYFKCQPDGSYHLLEEIRRMVRFETHNLADGPGFARPGLRAMDLIVCRNALMYFSPPQAARAVTRLSGCLGERGWLVLAPGEVQLSAGKGFDFVSQPDAILLRKQADAAPARSAADAPASATGGARIASKTDGGPHPGRPSGRQAALPPPIAGAVAGNSTRELEQSARACANGGQHEQALAWCARWIALDRLDPHAHHLHAMVLLELGDAKGAQAALRRVLFLDEGFVMAHVALGHLARGNSDELAACQHFDHARRQLERRPPDAVLPESDQLTVAHLLAMLRTLRCAEDVS
ncbi:MAG: CheR family methyltransferase [Burkholderiaceae bacterium]